MTTKNNDKRLEFMQLQSRMNHDEDFVVNEPLLNKSLARKLQKASVNTEFNIKDFNAMVKYCKEHRISKQQDLIRYVMSAFLKKHDYL